MQPVSHAKRLILLPTMGRLFRHCRTRDYTDNNWCQLSRAEMRVSETLEDVSDSTGALRTRESSRTTSGRGRQTSGRHAERDECSLAHARHLLAVQLKADGGEQYRNSPSYRGQQFLRLSVFESPSHTSCAAMKPYGGSRAAMTRFCRAVLNHTPLGSFRRHFFSESANRPVCGVLQNRAHVLLTCPSIVGGGSGQGEFEFLQSVSA